MSENKKPADVRHPTMSDVAKHVGVSRQLVGLAFRNETGVSAETAAKIFAAAKELGYAPNFAAQALRRDGTRYIGVTYHTSHSSTEALLPALYTQAEVQGFKLILSAVSNFRSDEVAIDEIIGHRCDGMILISSDLSIGRLKQIGKNMPMVVLSRRIADVNCGVVTSDGETGISLAVEHLVQLGHKQIAYVDTTSMHDHEYRLAGYLKGTKEAGLPEDKVEITGDYIESAGAIAAKKFLARASLPTAIVCSNDQVAFGLAYELQKAGLRVPEDISLTGYDDTVASLPFLDFTTVHQDAEELAAAAFADLGKRMSGEVSSAKIYLTSANLVVRSSTSVPRTA